MESTDGKSKKQAMADLSAETSENPKPDQVINSSDSKETSPPMAASKPPLEDQVQTEQVQEQEYVCRYCQKKFYNKQALGGHQNAHKVERALEKSAKESAKAAAAGMPPAYLSADFYPYPSLMGSHYYPNSFSRYPDRFFPYSIPPPPSPYPHTFLPMTPDPFAPRLLPGPTSNYHVGWSRPVMAARPPMRMQNPGGNAWLPPPPPPPPGDGGLNGLGAVLGMSAAGASSSSGIVNADNNEEPELDLTLKL